ncbi:erythrocyte membrane protein 1, PfEMP1, putative [Plasmodium reichenowi]|uniref:Erythrocyte membrane protein 1, PfEMP1, putative n=1 Tax=Plasmodium reichenowi TaxID=5854 RepID=A0A2P9D4Q2_PLARE|nr:erythrocyte membrane protein 1, PfEMP1, putative [Plasmodium reichenowi]
MRLSSFFVSLIYPKGDYNIPTLKSLNRHFPYARHLYKGKTYIYLKEDSGHNNYQDILPTYTFNAPSSTTHKIHLCIKTDEVINLRIMNGIKHKGYMYKKWNDNERLYKLNHKWNMEHNEDLLNINTYIIS